MTEKILVSAKSNSQPLKHFWSTCVGAGRANEGLRASWQDQLRAVVKECDFKYIRFHGLFHEDMCVYRKRQGKEVYNWQYIDDLFDRLLEIGIRPFVEFGFCPEDMASGDRTQFWWKGNITPPKAYTKWEELIQKAVNHWVDRYGIEEVRRWYFEVWNEPNLYGFWDGTKKDYFNLYKSTVTVIKAIDPTLRVGGPATSNFVPDERFAGEIEDKSQHLTFKIEDIDQLKWKAVWVEDFLDYCTEEKLAVDFISTHPYPTDFALDGHGKTRGLSRSIDSTKIDLKWLRDLVDKSHYPEAEIHLTEWSSSPSARDCAHDYLPAAAFVVKTNIESSGLVDSLSYWAFTDIFEEGGGGDSIFHGGFGMINFQGIVKPTYHAYRFLNLLGTEELDRGDGYIVSKSSDDHKLSLLIYHYPEEVEKAIPISPYPNRENAEKTMATGVTKAFSITIDSLKPGSRFIIETVSEEYGLAIKEWKAMGAPEPPNREQTQMLKEAGLGTQKDYVEVNDQGLLKIDLRVEPWNIISIREI